MSANRPDRAGKAPPFRGGLRSALTLLPLAMAAGLLVLGLLPGEVLRGLGDRLSSDGSAASLVLDNLVAVQRRLILFGGALLALSILFALVALRTPWPRLTHGAPSLARGLARFVREDRWHAILLGAFAVLNLSLAVSLLAKPISCDESYTTLYFATRSPLYIVCNYISPNNHVLHTLAAHASYALFGQELWALRLPALIAGVLTVPAAYVATRVHFGKRAAVVAAGLIATWPYLVEVDTNARGYSALNLIVLLLIALLPRLLNREARRAWAAFVVLAAAGLFLVPVMLFPLAFLLLWLAARALHELPRGARRGFFLRLSFSTLAVIILAVIAYSPSIIVHGIDVAFTRDFIRPKAPGSLAYGYVLELLGNSAAWMRQSWAFGELPWLLSALAVLGLLAPLALAGKRRSVAGTFLWTAVLGPLIVVFATAKVPPGRCITFLLVVLLVLVAAGLTATVGRLCGPRRALARGATFTLLLALCAVNVAGSVTHRREHWRMPWYSGYHDAPEAAAFLARRISTRDRVLGIREERPPLHYYYERLTGTRFLAFYPFDQESRDGIRVNPDMDESDRSSSVDGVWVIDTGKASERLGPLLEVLEKSGFSASGEVARLPHSRLVHYANTGESRLLGQHE